MTVAVVHCSGRTGNKEENMKQPIGLLVNLTRQTGAVGMALTPIALYFSLLVFRFHSTVIVIVVVITALRVGALYYGDDGLEEVSGISIHSFHG